MEPRGKNRERLLNEKVAGEFFALVEEQAAGLLSDDRFAADGTLVAAWAGHGRSNRTRFWTSFSEAGRARASGRNGFP